MEIRNLLRRLSWTRLPHHNQQTLTETTTKIRPEKATILPARRRRRGRTRRPEGLMPRHLFEDFRRVMKVARSQTRTAKVPVTVFSPRENSYS